MAGDGKPEKSSKRFGTRLAQIRAKRFTQKGLAYRLHPHMPIGESGVARYENGRPVKLSRRAVETISTACECTTTERRSLVIAADRNPFADPDGTTAEWAEALIHTLSALFKDPEIKTLMESFIRHRKVYQLSQAECDLILTEIRKLRRL